MYKVINLRKEWIFQKMKEIKCFKCKKKIWKKFKMISKIKKKILNLSKLNKFKMILS